MLTWTPLQLIEKFVFEFFAKNIRCFPIFFHFIFLHIFFLSNGQNISYESRWHYQSTAFLSFRSRRKSYCSELKKSMSWLFVISSWVGSCPSVCEIDEVSDYGLISRITFLPLLSCYSKGAPPTCWDDLPTNPINMNEVNSWDSRDKIDIVFIDILICSSLQS